MKSTCFKFGLTIVILSSLLLASCGMKPFAKAENQPVEIPETGSLPNPITEPEVIMEEVAQVVEEVDPMWETIEYDPADYTDWVEIDCNTQTGEGCQLPNGCNLSTGEGCTLPDGCNFVTRVGCVLPNGCNLETGEGCDLPNGCNPITLVGCPLVEGCIKETGEGCVIGGCNFITGEGCVTPEGCNFITNEGCTFPYGDGTVPDNWEEIEAMWDQVIADWETTEGTAEWQEGNYSGIDLVTGGEINGWDEITEEDIADFFNK
jgi:hypothetical protein